MRGFPEELRTLYRPRRRFRSSGPTLVFQAIRRADRLPVLVKTVLDVAKDSALAQTMKDEYQCLLNYPSPRFARVLAFHDLSGKPVLVREYGAGNSLALYFRWWRVSWRQFNVIALGLFDILEDLWRHGLVHRDIKPDNLIFDKKTGVLKLIDFSLAMKAGPNAVPFNLWQLQGTPAFMSPEQTGWLQHGCDHRADQYSAGASLYWLATGSPPFTASPPDRLLQQVLNERPKALSSIRQGFPNGLAEFIAQMLEKDPALRFPNPQAVRSAFADLLF